MGFKWPEETSSTHMSPLKLLAQNLPMKEIFNLKFDALIRGIDGTLFWGTDGGIATYSRCGGQLPAIYIKRGKTDKDFRIDFKEHTEKRLNDVWLGEIQLQNGIYLIKLKKIQNKTIDLNFVFLFIDYDWVYLLVMFQEIFVNFFGIFLPFKVH